MEIIIDNIKYETTKLDNGKWSLPEEIKKCLRSCCGALDIDGNRVETSDNWSRKEQVTNAHEGYQRKNSSSYTHKTEAEMHESGRYPSQTFCDSNTAEVLDKQSGVKIGNGHNSKTKVSGYGEFGGGKTEYFGVGNKLNDIGGCSKILHKCDFEDDEHDIYFYQPKVSKSERNAGCDDFEDRNYKMNRPKDSEIAPMINKNTHPTLKPIALNYRILKLFKTPNDQRICYPFAGSFSEVIGGYQAGFTNFTGCELNEEYIQIGEARLKYWTNKFEEENKQPQQQKLDI